MKLLPIANNLKLLTTNVLEHICLKAKPMLIEESWDRLWMHWGLGWARIRKMGSWNMPSIVLKVSKNLTEWLPRIIKIGKRWISILIGSKTMVLRCLKLLLKCITNGIQLSSQPKIFKLKKKFCLFQENLSSILRMPWILQLIVG